MSEEEDAAPLNSAQCRNPRKKQETSSKDNRKRKTDVEANSASGSSSTNGRNHKQPLSKQGRTDSFSEHEIPLADKLEHKIVPGSGLKHTNHGVIFQLNILSRALWRVSRDKNIKEFGLATELPNAEKFDDVVLMYKDGHQWTLRLLQAKHKHNECGISFKDLMTTNQESPFCLLKYFRSFVKVAKAWSDDIRPNTIFSKCYLQDVILLTNADLADDVLECMEMVNSSRNDPDILLGIESDSVKYYKLKQSQPILEPILWSHTDFNGLVEELVDNLLLPNRQINWTRSLQKEYYYPLVRNVFDIVMENGNYFAKLSKSFLEGSDPKVKKLSNAMGKLIAFRENNYMFIIPSELKSLDTEGQKKLAERLANDLVNKVELKSSNYSDSFIALGILIIDFKEGKLDSKFIKSTVAKAKDFRTFLQEAIKRVGPLDRCTIKNLQEMQVIVPRDFYQPDVPHDMRVSENLAEHLHKIRTENRSLNADSMGNFRAYLDPVTKEVIDVKTGKFHKNFLEGKLSPAGKMLQQYLVDAIIDDKTANTALKNTAEKKFPITKSFANQFQPKPSPSIKNPEKFAEEIADAIENCQDKDFRIDCSNKSADFLSNLSELLGHILFRVSTWFEFSENFVKETHLPGDLSEFHKLLKNRLKSKFESIGKYTFTIPNLEACEEAVFRRNLPNPITLDDIRDFYEKFRIVAGYPDKDGVLHLLEKEVENQYQNLDSKGFVALFCKDVENWMSHRMGTFYTSRRTKDLLQKTKEHLSCHELLGISESYLQAGVIPYEFNSECLVEYLKDFLKHSGIDIWLLISSNLFLCRAQFGQAFRVLQKMGNPDLKLYLHEFGYVFLTWEQFSDSSFQDMITTRNDDEDKWNFWLVECGDSSLLRTASESLPKIIDLMLYRTVRCSVRRKVIFLSQKSVLPAIKTAIQSRTDDVVVQMPDKKIGTVFSSVKKESQLKLLDSNLIRLHNRPLKLGDVLEQTTVDFIDEKTLEMFISNVPVDIECKHRLNMNYYMKRNIELIIFNPSEFQSTENESRYYLKIGTEKTDEIIVTDLEEVFIQNSEKQETKIPIHWFEKFGDKVIWRRSIGKITNLRKYRCSDMVTDTLNEEQFLRSTDDNQITIICGAPGVGKSQLLTSLFSASRNSKGAIWSIHVDLNLYSRFFNEIQQKQETHTQTFLLDLLKSRQHSQFNTQFEEDLLYNTLLNKTKIQLVLFFDGFDEISPNYKTVVLNYLQSFKDLPCIRKVFVSTRPTFVQCLEDDLNVLHHKLCDLKPHEQEEMFNQYMKIQNIPVEADILSKFIKGQSDFHVYPLHIKMLAEVSSEVVKRGELIPDTLNIITLYEKYIKLKFLIFRGEKMNQDLTNVSVTVDMEDIYPYYLEEHEILALHTFFSEEELRQFYGTKLEEETIKYKQILKNVQAGKQKYGIVFVIDSNDLQFIHRTFIEYFVAVFLVKVLVKPERVKKNVSELFLNEMIDKERFIDTLNFVDKWMELNLCGKVFQDGVFDEVGSDLEETTVFKAISYCSQQNLSGIRKYLFFLSMSSSEFITFDLYIMLNTLFNVEWLWKFIYMLHAELNWSTESWRTFPLITSSHCRALLQTDDEYATYNWKSSSYCTYQELYYPELKKAMSKWESDCLEPPAYMQEDALHFAVEKGDMNLCKILCKKNYLLLNHVTKNGDTVLHRSCKFGHRKMLMFLIDAMQMNNSFDASKIITARNRNGETLLHIAAQTMPDVVSDLLKHNISVFGVDIYGKTAFDYACIYCDEKTIQMLSEKVIDNVESNMPQTLLGVKTILYQVARSFDGSEPHMQVFSQCQMQMQCLLSDWPHENRLAEVNSSADSLNVSYIHQFASIIQQPFGVPFFRYNRRVSKSDPTSKHHAACVSGLVLWLRMLDNKNRDTVLHCAAYSGNAALCEWVLQLPYMARNSPRQICINDVNECGETPLHAATLGSVEVLETLQRHGANLNAKDNLGQSVLHHAAFHGREDMCMWLVKANADPSCRTKSGVTVLHAAAQSGNLKLVEWLVEKVHLSILEVAEKSRSNVLHFAASSGNRDLCEWLLTRLPQTNKCIINDRNNDGLTPLLNAAKYGDISMLDLLMENGAKLRFAETPAFSGVFLRNSILLNWLWTQIKNSFYFLDGIDRESELLKLIEEPCNHQFNRWLLSAALKNGPHNNLVDYIKSHSPVFNGTRKFLRMSTDISSSWINDLPISVLMRQLASYSFELFERAISTNVLTDCCDENGRTIVHHACLQGRLDIYKWLTENHICAYVPPAEMEDVPSVLHDAATSGNLELLQYVYDQTNANLLECTANGKSIYHCAAQSGEINLLKWCLDKTCNSSEEQRNALQKTDTQGRSLSHYAAAAGRMEMSRWLGGKVFFKLRARDLSSILHEASKSGSLELCQYFVHNGSNIADSNIHGDTAPSIAITNHHPALYEWFAMQENHDATNSSNAREVSVNNTLWRPSERFPYDFCIACIKGDIENCELLKCSTDTENRFHQKLRDAISRNGNLFGECCPVNYRVEYGPVIYLTHPVIGFNGLCETAAICFDEDDTKVCQLLLCKYSSSNSSLQKYLKMFMKETSGNFGFRQHILCKLQNTYNSFAQNVGVGALTIDETEEDGIMLFRDLVGPCSSLDASEKENEGFGGALELCNALIRAGLWPGGGNRKSPIHLAAARNYLNVCKLLLYSLSSTDDEFKARPSIQLVTTIKQASELLKLLNIYADGYFQSNANACIAR
ncbi:unnamed protein product [Hermetia illucens]|uniref:NACHT domain-containing protein n=2 Tax=Hermetia illucens TaxID=343691 RepID=A0A7R8V2V6_HERIL|nr:unnamed protein product [Hermetia illucens]